MTTNQIQIAKAMVRLDIIKRQVEFLNIQIASLEKQIDEKAKKLFEEKKSEVKQELTLRELKEFCVNADCEKCPFAQFDENEDGIRFQCNCDLDAPKYHDVDEVTKKVREASHVS